MLKTEFHKRASKYLLNIYPKHAQQIAWSIDLLRTNPVPSDSKKLAHSVYRRVDVGEHRIIYRYTEDLLIIPLIGKRNDGEVYRKLDRLEG